MKTSFPDSIPVALDQQAHRYAAQFAAQQTNSFKGKQVYLNTLAVCAVQSYLQWLSIYTRLDFGDCWNSGLRAMFNVADLVLPNIGKLECRPILPGQEQITVPLETLEDRLGYVAVHFDEQLKQVYLRGFLSAKAVNYSSTSVPLTQLQSLDTLLDVIELRQRSYHLQQWFKGLFDEQWQPVTTLLGAREIALRSISPLSQTDTAQDQKRIISRGKILTLQQGEQPQSVILVVRMTESENDEIDLRLQIYPEPNQDYLPSGLRVSIYDETDKLCMEAQTGYTDDGVQLEFSCLPQESFRLDLKLGNISLSEQFIV
ncbi:DUF1822 family protein [Chroococcus sp. FPU101]|uniref:DUF1822 family protein n=1 Tax=Chroococcus sp. FPU101 TaxID=1974212 RepID=UPI001A8F36AD|nr:DUF1822 family protein [Chroococcus sp. FPU101]GFE71328.1 hypothetical protein CFPU101_39380 [Chroococcus sp. FPU101]